MQLSSKNVGVRDIVSSTFKSAGPLGFYRGLSAMVYFAAPKASIRFMSFETVSGLLTGPNGEDKFNLGGAKGFVAGLGAGTMEAIFVTTPQETIKVRLINDAFRTDGPPHYRNFFHGVKTIVSEFGIWGIYKGLFPTIIKVSTVSFRKYMNIEYQLARWSTQTFLFSILSTYSTCCRLQAQATRFGVFHVIPTESRNTPVKAAASGAFAGGVSVLLFQGIDVGKFVIGDSEPLWR